MRTAFSSMAWNTGSNSPGDLEMTCNTSEVAVCCSNASESSRVRACTSSNSRTFSIAITAWSAKVWTSSICLSVNGCTSARANTSTPINLPSRSIGTPSRVRPAATPRPCSNVSSGSDRASLIWMDLASSATRPTIDVRSTATG